MAKTLSQVGKTVLATAFTDDQTRMAVGNLLLIKGGEKKADDDNPDFPGLVVAMYQASASFKIEAPQRLLPEDLAVVETVLGQVPADVVQKGQAKLSEAVAKNAVLKVALDTPPSGAGSMPPWVWWGVTIAIGAVGGAYWFKHAKGRWPWEKE